MALLTTNGLSEFSFTMEELSDLPGSVVEDMLNAEADIVVEAQKRKGRAYGVHRTGVTLSSIRKGRIHSTSDEKKIYVTPQGVNDRGNRNAEVAFVNEYGTSKQAPRPFIRDANEESIDSAVEAAEEVLDAYLANSGF